jgi:cell division transport system ATP-binding protein
MIHFENVSKTFGTGEMALSDITLDIQRGEFVFLVGPSGSGKTTLMRMLIRDTLPTQGRVIVSDWDLNKLPSNKVPDLRKKIGVVFQDLKLLTERTIFENILLPLHIAGVSDATAVKKVHDIMEQVGILQHKDKFPVQLSGGELQRAAIARALIFSPDILLADEPTGNLDMTTSWEIVKLLQDINKTGTTVIMATHNTDIVNSLLKRIVGLEKGKLAKDEKRGEKKEDEKVKEEKKEAAPVLTDEKRVQEKETKEVEETAKVPELTEKAEEKKDEEAKR